MEGKAKKRSNYYLDSTQNEIQEERKLTKKEWYDKNFSEKAGPMNMQKLKDWSKWFHANVPPNPFEKRKIPWKTIFIVLFNY